MKSVYISEEYCCGCTACQSVCPQKAISMHEDNVGGGYKYSVIDGHKCIDCGLCQKVCQFKTREIEGAHSAVDCYAFKHKDKCVIDNSRSAGAFTAFSDYVLENGGVIYGVILDENFCVRHTRAVTKEQRDLLRKSKYVQSDIEGIFSEVKKDLFENKIVMFTGTGCQCDGLRAYLNTKGVNTEGLLLVDIVCHGVPSPKMFDEYISWNKKKKKSSLVSFDFRDKEKYSWGEGIEKLVFASKRVVYQDYFTDFIFDNFVRPSCYNCKYTTAYRNSDITLGDFWGSEKSCPEFTDFKNGTSLLLIHSKKANAIFEKIKTSVFYKKIAINQCLQPRLIEPRKKTDDADKYFEVYAEKGFEYLMDNYAQNSVSLKNRSVRILKRIKNKIINRLEVRKID